MIWKEIADKQPLIAFDLDRCDAQLYDVTRHVADLEGELKAAIEPFDTRVERRTCRPCGSAQPEPPPVPPPPYCTGSGPWRGR